MYTHSFQNLRKRMILHMSAFVDAQICEYITSEYYVSGPQSSDF